MKLICLILGILFLGGCKKYEPVESAVSNALIAVQNFDESTVNRYFESDILNPNEIFTQEVLNEVPLELMMPQLIERFMFYILEVEEGETLVTVTVKMSNVDMKQVMPKFFLQVLEDLFSRLQLTDEGQQNINELDKDYHQIMKYLIHDLDTEKIDQIVEMHLVKGESGWKIIVDQELLDGIYGGLITYFKDK